MLVRNRLLYAVRPPPDAAARIAEDARAFGPGHFLGADRLHITLGLFGDHDDFPHDQAQRLVRAAESIACARFRVVFDWALASSSSVALRASEPLPRLDRLHHRLGIAAATAGATMRRRERFVPHVTLVHRRGPSFAEGFDPISWEVRDFFLINSRLGAGRHEILGRWLLA